MKYKSLLRKSLITACGFFIMNHCHAQFPVNIGMLPAGKTIIVQNSVIIRSNDNCNPITLSFAQNSIVPTRTFTCADILAGNQAANINVTMWVTDP